MKLVFYKKAFSSKLSNRMGSFSQYQARLPVYGDLAGLPPILLHVSTIEMLRDHSVCFAEKARVAGVDVTLQEFKDMTHAFLTSGYNAGWPEVEDGFQKAGAFMEKIFR